MACSGQMLQAVLVKLKMNKTSFLSGEEKMKVKNIYKRKYICTDRQGSEIGILGKSEMLYKETPLVKVGNMNNPLWMAGNYTEEYLNKCCFLPI